MTVSTRNELVTAPDGGEFDAHAFVPDAPGPGILLLQEIYGVGEFLKARATLLAGLGYAVLVPDVFWRVERNVSLSHDDEGLQAAFGYSGRFAEIPAETTTGDLVSALEHLRTLPEVSGKVGVLGYCLGGRLAYEVAAAGRPDACVAYYGSGIGGELDVATRITCPIMFHYGGADPYISRQEIDAVTAAFGGRRDAEIVVQERAGHAFENSFAPAFSNPQAAAASWPVTVSFLERTLMS
ncbi:MAG: dienelactone hydrolase family protein [Acidimicrobiales bacterium]